ncbi:MAG TPA: threo-3-hydroxy-L-aspartate ammonia-lyase [Burkholderiales bacterium]|nr:threo-3-hydroxy-L-aspartate ammonia-lyase [Burkholderiales bacterium]
MSTHAGDPETPLRVTYADVHAAARRLAGKAHRTPVLTSRTVDERIGARVFFKCENLQRGGAFKFRGAYNALANLGPAQKHAGVVAYSSGNHAQAVALAGRLLGIPAIIVMPSDAPPVKVEGTRGYGAEVILYDRARDDREAIALKLASERGVTLIPPFNHPHIVAGQGTAALELLEETGPLDVLLVPCGGGGLLSGCAIAAEALSPGIRVIGVEPAAGDDVTRSFRSGTIQRVDNPDTIADGARTSAPGDLTFPLIMRYVADMLTVDDTELLRTMWYLWERMKIIVEPTGALGAAAALEGKLDLRDRRVGVVLSGGNADLKQLCRLL